MRYMALACDYDGTLALDGQVDAETVAALERVRDSGRKLLLVTGRELDDLLTVFPHAHLFDRIVAENGALLYAPATGTERRLWGSPPQAFVQALRAGGGGPHSLGRGGFGTPDPTPKTRARTTRGLWA